MRWFRRDRRSTSFHHQMAQVKLFRNLVERELEIIAGFLHYRKFLAGEVIFDAGEPGQTLYIVISGNVAISLPGLHDAPLVEMQANNFFGELGLLDDWPRSAQARATAQTEVAVLFRGDFERLMALHATIAAKITLQLAHHLGQLLRQIMSQNSEQGSVQ